MLRRMLGARQSFDQISIFIKNVGDFHSNSKPIFCRKILSKDFVEHFVEHFVERLDAFRRRILSKDFVEGFCRNMGGILSKDCLEHFVGDGVVHLKNKFVLKFVLFWSLFVLRPKTGVIFGCIYIYIYR